jgi:hypothetical protein
MEIPHQSNKQKQLILWLDKILFKSRWPFKRASSRPSRPSVQKGVQQAVQPDRPEVRLGDRPDGPSRRPSSRPSRPSVEKAVQQTVQAVRREGRPADRPGRPSRRPSSRPSVDKAVQKSVDEARPSSPLAQRSRRRRTSIHFRTYSSSVDGIQPDFILTDAGNES